MTCLMFLENLMVENISEHGFRMLSIVISQLNSLLCMVNDILDYQMIEEDKFVAKIQEFSPEKTL